jgi:serine phosphatase RsbU (regulator of sigma subunit)
MDPAGTCFSIERLHRTLQSVPRESCRVIADAVKAEVDGYQDTAVQSDDITIVALRYTGVGGGT